MEFHLSEEDIAELEERLCILSDLYNKNGYDDTPSGEFNEILEMLDDQIREFEE